MVVIFDVLQPRLFSKKGVSIIETERDLIYLCLCIFYRTFLAALFWNVLKVLFCIHLYFNLLTMNVIYIYIYNTFTKLPICRIVKCTSLVKCGRSFPRHVVCKALQGITFSWPKAMH